MSKGAVEYHTAHHLITDQINRSPTADHTVLEVLKFMLVRMHSIEIQLERIEEEIEKKKKTGAEITDREPTQS